MIVIRQQNACMRLCENSFLTCRVWGGVVEEVGGVLTRITLPDCTDSCSWPGLAAVVGGGPVGVGRDSTRLGG